MKRIVTIFGLAIVLVAAVLLALPVSVVSAQGGGGNPAPVSPGISITQGVANLCANTGTTFQLPIRVYLPDAGNFSFDYVMTAPADGAQVANGSGTFTGPLDELQNLDITPNAYQLNSGEFINVTIRTFAEGQTDPMFVSSLDFDCAAGTASTRRVPFVPGHFVLRVIVCDTPVFDTPGGTAIPNTLIRVGQTWFVNPLPFGLSALDTQQDQQGLQSQQAQQAITDQELIGRWTEIFVGGFDLAFVPTDCAGFFPGLPEQQIQQNQQSQQTQQTQ